MTHQVAFEIHFQMSNQNVKKMNISWSDIKLGLVSVDGEDIRSISDQYLQLQFMHVKRERNKFRRTKDPVKYDGFLESQYVP